MLPNWTQLREQLLGKHATSQKPPKFDLPILPAALTEFLQSSNDPAATPENLGHIVQRDAGLTGELLRYTNSSVLGLRCRASIPRQAITLLGIRKTKLYLIEQGVKSAIVARQSRLLNIQRFWIANLERALVAREFARLLQTDVDLAFSGALLSDALLPIVANEFLSDYLEYLRLPEQGAPDLHTFEQAHRGWDHAFFTANVMHAWGFPDDLVCCVGLHHAGTGILQQTQLKSSAVAAVALASLIPDALSQSRNGLEDLFRLQQSWPEFQFLALADRVGEQFEQLSPNCKLSLPLKRRCEQWLDQHPTLQTELLAAGSNV